MTSGQGRVVVVVGPPLAGVSGVVAGLRALLPELTVLDGSGADRGPDAVVAVVSAVAPLTRSDWAHVERVAAHTDLVIGVVAKIDAHRGWRETLETDRALVGRWDGRGDAMPWVGAAAAPDLGEARLDDLVDVLRDRLSDPDLGPRREGRSRAVRLSARPGGGRRDVERRREVQRARLDLLRFVRDRCATLRTELRELASAVSTGGAPAFETVVRAEADRFVVELDAEIDRATGTAATRRREPPDVARSASSSRRLEGRLMAVLGVGFGMGIALASGRLLAGLAPGLSAAGLATGAAVGLGLVVWVVRVRGLLHDRALLDRWVGEVVATLRWHGEAMVAERLLAVESAPPRATDEGSRRRLASTRVDVTDQYEW